MTNAAHAAVSRRQLLLRSAAMLAGPSLLAACGGAAPAQATLTAGTSASRPLETALTSTATSRSASAAVPATTAQPASRGGALSVFLPSTGSLAPGWTLLMPRFRAANPALKVDSSPTVDVTKLQAIIAAGTPPDVTHFDRYQVVTWSVKGLFQPVDDLLRGLDPAKTFLGPTIKEATYQGKLYAMPQDTGIRGLFWNVAQLQQAGLDAQQGPQTWDDLAHYAQALTQQGGDPSTQRFGFLPWIGNWSHIGWIWTFGGDYFDDKTFRPTLNRPENVQAFDWMLGYAKRYGTPDTLAKQGLTGDLLKTFAQTGRLSMLAAHWGLTGAIQQSTPSFQYGGNVVPHPPGGQNGTWQGGFSFARPVGGKHPEAVQLLYQFLATTPSQRDYYQATRQLPASSAALDQVQQSIAAPGSRFLAQLPIAHWRWPFTDVMTQALGQVQNDVLGLKTPTRQALDSAQQTILAQYAQYWGK